MVLEEFLPEQTFHFMLVFCRVGTMFILMPGIGETFVMPRVRLCIALLVSIVLVPLLELPVLPVHTAAFLHLVGHEALTGLFLGALGRILLLALDTAGNVAGQQLGLGNAMLFNPTMAQQGAILGVFLGICGGMVVLATNMHLLFLQTLKDSYIAFPPGSTFPAEDMAMYFSRLVGQSMLLAIQLSAPFLVIGLVFNVGLGLLSRLMPQLQAYFVATSLQLALGLFVLMLVVGTILRHFAGALDNAVMAVPDF